MLSEKSPIYSHITINSRIVNALAIGCGRSLLYGYRCLAIPSDKQQGCDYTFFVCLKTKSAMGIFNLFSKKIKRFDYCLVRDLLAVTITPNGLSPISKRNILEIMKSKGIQPQILDEVMMLDPDKISDCYPDSQKEKERFLFSVAYAMAKEKVTPKRKAYLNVIASKMGLSAEDVYLTLESINSSPF